MSEGGGRWRQRLRFPPNWVRLSARPAFDVPAHTGAAGWFQPVAGVLLPPPITTIGSPAGLPPLPGLLFSPLPFPQSPGRCQDNLSFFFFGPLPLWNTEPSPVATP